MLAADLNNTTLVSRPLTVRETVIRVKTHGLLNPYLSKLPLSRVTAQRIRGASFEEILPDLFGIVEPLPSPILASPTDAIEGWRIIFDACGLNYRDYAQTLYERRVQVRERLEERRLARSLRDKELGKIPKERLQQYVLARLPRLLREEEKINTNVYLDSFYLPEHQYEGMKRLTSENFNRPVEKQNHIVIVSSSPADQKRALIAKMQEEKISRFLSPLIWGLVRIDDTVPSPDFKALANLPLREIASKQGMDHEGYEDDFVPASWNAALLGMKYYIARNPFLQFIQRDLLPRRNIFNSQTMFHYSAQYGDIARARGQV